jgi:2'-5' RNA ligase
MAFAVILYLDPDAEANVKAVWDALAEQDISSVMAMMNIRPHISLTGFDSYGAVPMCAELHAFAKSVAPLTVKLSAVGAFPTEQGVVYLAPMVTAELVRLHEAFHSQLTRLGLSPSEFYRPENWVPHCTVALKLPPERISTVIDCCKKSNVFRPVQLVEIALVEYMPVRDLCAFPLGDMTYDEPHRNP